jgi:hypothetical protein
MILTRFLRISPETTDYGRVGDHPPGIVLGVANAPKSNGCVALTLSFSGRIA